MYILDNTIWFLSFVFLDFNPISLLAKQLSIRFNYCCTEGKIPAYLKKTIGLSIKKVKPNNSARKLSQIAQTPLSVHEPCSDKIKGNEFAEFLVLLHAFFSLVNRNRL